MLKVKGLSFSYGDFSVENVCFEVKEGEILTLLGPNGSGKTTILKNVYGLLKPKKKCVFIDGRDFHSLSLKERAKLAGYVLQSHYPPFPYTVLDVVVMGLASQLSVFESPREEHYEKALEKLRLLGMESFKDRPYTQLSGGQLQLVLIARALVQEPKVLLLDEPTAHLDFKNQVKILGIIKKLAREERITAILTLHDPNLASIYSDKIALVKEGRIRAVGESSEILREEILEEVYGVPIHILEFNGFRVIMPKTEVV
ncbi:ABC transporter [Thermococcus sp. EP1]|uniref:ABC transporter ATP-binding protein n=1 Tax=Thermococcus sp. EP1 TaxID=1591054 RepID=UPI0006DA205E|nr:ABC transporter ATP-binding protein [Thermococcus sp. EP1]KPU62497.1 ABC transporter [Thermococcus sp. EP1]